jgi:segregation and condensation protein A
VSFRRLIEDAPSRLDAIVRFLAALELYKQGVVDIEQFSTFGDLQLRRLSEGESALDAASLADWDDDVDGAPSARRPGIAVGSEGRP